MNSTWASLPRLDIATFGYSGMQRSIGRFAVAACHGEIRRGRPDRMIKPHRKLDRNFVVQHDEGATGPGYCRLTRRAGATE
jgi:hypothetical protein